jgi:hypothetical protein
MMEKDDNDKFCRMGVVEEVKEGPDGCVRTATVRYTNPGGDPCSHSNPKLVVRPIHKLAVIVPVDYRFEEDLAGEERAKPGELTKPATRWRPRRGREGNPTSEEMDRENRPKREAARKAMEALRKGADVIRGRGRRKSRKYQGAGGNG